MLPTFLDVFVHKMPVNSHALVPHISVIEILSGFFNSSLAQIIFGIVLGIAIF